MRLLVEIDAAVGLKKEVIMAIPEEEGDGYIKEIVSVEYEWKPPHCVDCRSFGHDTLLCPNRIREEVPNNSARVDKTTVMEENEDGFTEVKNRKKKKGADFGGIRLNKPKSKVMWQQKKSVEPSNSSNVVGNDKNESNPGLNTSNPFDVLNVDGDAMDETGTQQKVSDVSSSDLNVKKVDASKPSCSKSDHSDSHKDMNVRSPTEWKKWDVINEDDTTDDEAVFAPNGGSLGGGSSTMKSSPNQVVDGIRKGNPFSKVGEVDDSDSDDNEVFESNDHMGSYFSSAVDLISDEDAAHVYDLPRHLDEFCDQFDVKIQDRPRK